MTKIFRNVRQTFLAEGKTSNYFKYAIGEILLVMIGILLALEVSNWSDTKKEREIEKSLLTNVLKGLIKDSVDIEFNKVNHIKCLISQRIVIDWLGSKRTFHDSLRRHISLSHRFTQFISRDSPYETLKTAGLQLISNDTLQEQISILYDENYDLYDEHEKYYTSLITNMILHTNGNLFDVSDPVVYNAPKLEGAMTPRNPELLRNDNQFTHHLKTSMLENEMFIHYVMVSVQERIDNVKTLIRRELRKD